MKYGIVIAIMAVLGLGEYAFVEYYPLSPQQRVRKVKKLPLVRSIISAGDIRTIRDAIEESDSGFVSIVRNGEKKEWDDAKSLYADYQNRDPLARSLVYGILNGAGTKDVNAMVRERAEEGDPSAMMQLYWIGNNVNDDSMRVQARMLLENHDTAMADLYLNVYVLKKVSLNSRPGMLMFAREAQENYRVPGIPDDAFVKISNNREKRLEALRQAAADGDADATWVINMLDGSTRDEQVQ